MMTENQIGELMNEFFMLCIQLAGPALVISMLIGILISVLQAATQIHEQTLSFVPKLLAIGVILVFSGSSMLQTLQEFTEKVFRMIQG